MVSVFPLQCQTALLDIQLAKQIIEMDPHVLTKCFLQGLLQMGPHEEENEQDGDIIWVVVSPDCQMLGFIHAIPRKDFVCKLDDAIPVLEIYNLFVSDPFQRQGYGSLLLNQIENKYPRSLLVVQTQSTFFPHKGFKYWGHPDADRLNSIFNFDTCFDRRRTWKTINF